MAQNLTKEKFYKRSLQKPRFYKVYNNLPLPLRNEVILVIDGEPISWKVAKLEIDNNTKLGYTIMEKLEALRII